MMIGLGLDLLILATRIWVDLQTLSTSGLLFGGSDGGSALSYCFL